MSAHCCNHGSQPEASAADPWWRRALWIALVVNAVMFAVEITAGAARRAAGHCRPTRSTSSPTPPITPSRSASPAWRLAWRARAALFKGISLLALGGYVLVGAGLSAFEGSAPDAPTIGAIGALALVANLAVAALLYRWRAGDANMQSVWICTRNDAIANVAVLAAALGVFGTGTRWPDLAVATAMAVLSLTGGVRIIRLALAEMREARIPAQPAALLS